MSRVENERTGATKTKRDVSPGIGETQPQSLDQGVKVLDAVVLHLGELGNLAFLLHLVEDPKSEERCESLTVGRALENIHRKGGRKSVGRRFKLGGSGMIEERETRGKRKRTS